MKKLLLTTLIFVVLFGGFVMNTEDNATNVRIVHAMQAELDSYSRSYDEIVSYIEKYEAPSVNVLNQIVDLIECNPNYRMYYGGVYLDKNKNPVLCLTSDEDEVIKPFTEVEGAERLIIQRVRYTYDYLEKTMAVLNEKYGSDYSALSQYTNSYYEDISINKIVVELLSNESENQMAVIALTGIDPDVISFSTGYSYEEAISILAGNRIYSGINTNSTFKSVGYRGYRVDSSNNAHYGFTSCGHGPFTYAYYGGQLVGTLFDSLFSGAVDFSFYDAAPSVVLSNTTAYCDDEGNTENAPVLSIAAAPDNKIYMGQTLIKVGSVSFLTSGTISSVNSSCNGLFPLVRSNTLVLLGDSGGPGFIYNNGVCQVVGLVSGVEYTGSSLTYGSFLYSYFTKYSINWHSLTSDIMRY